MRTIATAESAMAAILIAAVAAGGCRRAGNEEAQHAPGAATSATVAVEPNEGREADEEGERDEQHERVGEGEDDSEEAKESAEEARMRQRALESLQAYRAPTCSEAVAKIEEQLGRGKGRWQERNERGAIPTDLLQALTQAELWSAQSESACKNDPSRQRFDKLRALMLTIWAYPRTASRAMLDERLRVLDQ